MKKLLVFLAGVWCLSSAILLSAGPIEIPANAGTRISGLEGATSANANAVTVLGALSNSWIKGASDALTATNDMAELKGKTNAYDQAVADGASWTNAKATALKSVTNSWTDTNGIPWYVVFSAAGMITHWSTNVP